MKRCLTNMTRLKSKYTLQFWLKIEGDDAIRIDCNDWSKNIESKYNWGDNFSVAAVTREINIGL